MARITRKYMFKDMAEEEPMVILSEPTGEKYLIEYTCNDGDRSVLEGSCCIFTLDVDLPTSEAIVNWLKEHATYNAAQKIFKG